MTRKSSTALPVPLFTPFVPALVSARATKAMLDAWTGVGVISWSAPWVIGMRLSRLATDGASRANQREVTRMFAEKADAVNESTAAINRFMFAAMTDFSPFGGRPQPARVNRAFNRAVIAADRSVRPFSRRVGANRKRLSRTR